MPCEGDITPQQQEQLDKLKHQVQEVKDFKAGRKAPSLIPAPAAYWLNLQVYNPVLVA